MFCVWYNGFVPGWLSGVSKIKRNRNGKES
nr:MAG TPA: hypothetical protein [Caudoviricetes sp.]